MPQFYAESALKPKDQLAESPYVLLDAIPVGVLVLAQDGGILACNAAAAQLLGVPPERVVGAPSLSAVISVVRSDGAIAASGTDELTARVRTRLAGEFELQIRRGERLIELDLQLRTAATAPPTLVASLRERDVERGRVRECLSAVPALCFHVSADGRILDFFAGPPEQLYCPPAQFRGRPFAEALPPEVASALGEALRRCRESGQTQQCEYSLDLPAGRRRFLARMAPISHGEFVAIATDVTEQWLDREALRSREQLLSTILDHQTECLRLVDREGRVQMLNASGLAMTEVDSFEQLRGKVALALIYPEDRDAYLAGHRAALAGRSSGAVYRITGARGTIRTLETNFAPLRDSSGAVVSVVGVSRDVTAKQRVEAELRAKEARWRALIDSALVGIALLDRDGRIELANPELCRITGYSAAELTGRSICDLTLPADAPRCLARVGRVFETGAEDRVEVRWVRKDGESVWVVTSFTHLVDGAAAGERVLCTCQDTTATRRALDALRESERDLRASRQRFLDLVNSLDCIVFEFDARRERFTFVSSSAERILGYPVRDWIAGAVWPERIVADDRARTVEYCRAESLAARDHRMEYRMTRADGREIWIHDTVTIDRENESLVRGVMVDVTERKQLAAQVLESQKIEAIGRLAGGIAHDFNNFVTALWGLIDVAASQLEPASPVQATLREMQTTSQRAAELTRHLLAFARKQVIEPRPVHLNESIEELVRTVERLLGARIRTALDLEPRTGVVRLDPTQLQQVLFNLAINARDAMPDGGEFRIRTRLIRIGPAEAQSLGLIEGAYAELDISDTGIGMDDTTRARIFEPFFTTKPVGAGTGLGLAMVLGIVRQSGGAIEVDSKPGVGTTFRILLPSAAETPESAAPAAPAKPQRAFETVLLVEDDRGVRDLARHALQAAGYVVIDAGSGEEALRAIDGREQSIDLLLTDVIMPGMRGDELSRAVVRRCPAIRVLFTSGYSEDILSTGGELIDGVQLLPKPYTPSALLERVQGVLRGGARPAGGAQGD